MKKILLDNIKYIKLSDLIAPFIFILIFPASIFFRLINKIKKRDLWLICENGKTARDNGYHFYKYIKEKYPNDYCFYVIDKDCNDYNKIKEYGNIIQYKSLKHWLYYLSAKFNISSQKDGNPNQPFFYVIHVIMGLYKNRVFLQHGITKDMSDWLLYKNTKFKYFICGAKREYEYVKKMYGYPNGAVQYIGFARFDNLHNNKINEKQILIMPTWRNYLGRETNNLTKKVIFKETEYYKNWNKLINNKQLIDYIEKENITILFYLHINMQKFLSEFKSTSPNIKLINLDTDIQQVLKESALMITDYSSVFMDFAYMRKPVIYFQFDQKEYREKQYTEGYFKYERDGFGPVLERENDVVTQIIKYVENNFISEEKYRKKMEEFFKIYDQKNCERQYKLLKGDKVE